jgi:hypothetical protein
MEPYCGQQRCFIFRALQGYKCLRIRTSDALAGNSSRKTAFTGALVGRNPEGLSGAPQTWKLKGSKFQPGEILAVKAPSVELYRRPVSRCWKARRRELSSHRHRTAWLRAWDDHLFG